MNKNQKAVSLALIGGCVLMLLIVYGYRLLVTDAPIQCPDGATRPRIDSVGFQTQYSGHLARLEAKLGPGKELKGELASTQLMAMSEAIQLARLHLQALAESYNACIVTVGEFNDSRKTFVILENLARQINELTAHGPKSGGDDARLTKLIDQFIQTARESAVKTK